MLKVVEAVSNEKFPVLSYTTTNINADVDGKDGQTRNLVGAAQMKEPDRELRILIVGNRGVGKTCLIKQFCRCHTK